MYRSQIESYFEGREPQLVELISRLVRIDSAMGEPEPGRPFGPGPAAALEEALAIAAELGMPGENHEGYVGTVDLNDKETYLHILGHMDVVPAGEGWTKTGAFEPLLEGDILYGRGVDDDKGPMVAALLALKCVKDLNLPMKYNARILLGTDEETGFRDINWYYARHPYAPCTFSPDAEFPITNIEKGHFQPTFRSEWEEETALPRVTMIEGSARVNVVPAVARAAVRGLDEAAVREAVSAAGLEPEITFAFAQEGEELRITCTGLGAHGSKPEEGHNALTGLLRVLSLLPLADGPSAAAIRTLCAMMPHGDVDGTSFGVAQADEKSGALSLAFSMLNLSGTGFTGRFDIRTPLCAGEDTVCEPIRAAMARAGFTIEGAFDPPHYVPEDSDFIRILSRCYERYTGRPGECLSMGGGTYVHGIPGGVAFGAGTLDFDSHLHGPDERVRVSMLMTAAKIFAQVILELCGAAEEA